jgi:CHAD domain-containing protein
MTVSQSRYELLYHRLARFTRTLQGVKNGEALAVHRARVAARRLREVLPVLELERDVARRFGRRLRRVTRRLGTVREPDSLLVIVEHLRNSRRFDETALEIVASALVAEQAERRAALGDKLPADELERLAGKLEKLARNLTGDGQSRAATRGWRWAIDARVAHRTAILRRAIDDAGNVYLGGRVHAVRIALKKLRYAVELKAESSADGPTDKSLRQDLAQLKRLQGLLGRLHDREMLMHRVRRVQASLTPPNLPVWHALNQLLRGLELECRRMHARYVREVAPLLALCERRSGVAPAASARRRVI